jgi:hypothetical protein
MNDDTDDPSNLHEFRHYLHEWSEEVNLLRQNRLLDEGAFISFAKDCGISVSGVIQGDPHEFNQRGWLFQDGTLGDGRSLYHPFRIYPLYRILKACKLNLSPSTSLNRQRLPSMVQHVVEHFLPSDDQISELAREWNRITDLAILLEPVYWPTVSGKLTRPALTSEDDYQRFREKYREKALHLIGTLNREEWQKIHQELRIQAAILDDNGPLYLLLRLSRWERREKLKGSIACALWIRHMAEITRIAFEQVGNDQWDEEDRAFGIWHRGGRSIL